MQADRIKQAAQILYEARRQHWQIDSLPDECAPISVAEGYAIQNELIRLIGEPVVGWKIGCITEQAQQRAGTTEPFCGPVLKCDLYHSGCEIPRDSCFTPALQAEFAFRLRRDLSAQEAPISIEVVREAVGTVLPALEVADSRFVDSTAVGAASLVADGGKAGFLILGEREADVRDVDLINHNVTLHVGGKEVARGCGRNVMGDPMRSLHWLANAMARRGDSLRAGCVVSTGTCTGSYFASPGDEVVVDYGALDAIEARFA